MLAFLLPSLAFAADIEAVKGKVADGYNFWFYQPPVSLATAEDSLRGKPLIVFLHGASLCGTDMNKVRRYGTVNALEKGRDIDAYVVAPQNPGGSWKPEKVMNIVDYVSGLYKVDPDRIYVLGMSLGGYGAVDFAATYPDRVAAAIGICGGASVKNLEGLAEVPLWLVHGTADGAVSIAQSDRVARKVRAARKDGPDRLQYERVAGMNHSQPARILYNPATYDWLLSHRLSDEGRPVKTAPKITQSFLSAAYADLDHSKGYKVKSSAKKRSKSSSRKKRKRR